MEYIVSSELYDEVACKLAATIGTNRYFNSSITLDFTDRHSAATVAAAIQERTAQEAVTGEVTERDSVDVAKTNVAEYEATATIFEALQSLPVECCLTCTLFVDFREAHYPEGEALRVDDAVPVWWEFSTTTLQPLVDEAGETLVERYKTLQNDFSFEEIRKRFRSPYFAC